MSKYTVLIPGIVCLYNSSWNSLYCNDYHIIDVDPQGSMNNINSLVIT